jgi:4-hydroxybutyrate dehydrogenase
MSTAARPLTSFSYPTSIRFGAGAIDALGDVAKAWGKRPLVVTDPGVAALPLFGLVVEKLEAAGLTVATYTECAGNPDTSHVDAGAAAYRAGDCDMVVGLGGGSPLDAAKAVALAVSHPGSVCDYDDRLDGWQRIGPSVPPIVAIPTTAGTGSEVGRSSVITNPENHLKTVIFSPYLLPKVALIDPAIMTGLPPHLTAATGMDALSHNVEAFCAKGFHPMADGIALEGIRLIGLYLERAVKDGDDIEAREGMAAASFMGAVAFQKGLGATHSLAHPLSTLADMHHGLANALFLHHVMAFNRDVAEDRLARIGTAFGLEGSEAARAQGAIDFVRDLGQRIGIPAGLGAAGVDRGLLDALVEQAVADACHLSNPKACTAEDFRALYSKGF